MPMLRKVALDALMPVPGSTSSDSLLSARSPLYFGLLVLILDLLRLESFSPLRSHARIGGFVPILAFLHLESLLSARGLSCLDPAPSAMQLGRSDFSVLALDLLHLDLSLFPRSLAQPDVSLPILDWASFDSSLSLKSRA